MRWRLSARRHVSQFAASCRTACRFKQGISGSRQTVWRSARTSYPFDQAQLDFAAGPMGILDEAAIQKVIKAIGYAIKSDCKPL